MRIFRRGLYAVVVFLASGCASATPIKDLALPPVVIIEGTVAHLDEGGFTLTDHSGEIFVRAKLANNTKLPLEPNEKIRVYGNLQGGTEKSFDGYVIKKGTGEQIVVSNPSPHFGLIIQSAFQ